MESNNSDSESPKKRKSNDEVSSNCEQANNSSKLAMSNLPLELEQHNDCSGSDNREELPLPSTAGHSQVSGPNDLSLNGPSAMANLDFGHLPPTRVAYLNGDYHVLTQTRCSNCLPERNISEGNPCHQQLYLKQQLEMERRRTSCSNSRRTAAVFDLLGIPIGTAQRNMVPAPPNPKDTRLSYLKRLISKYSKVLSLDQISNSEKEANCVVCYMKLGDRHQPLRELPCCHRFHKKCIDKWLVNQMSCPICRLPLKGSGALFGSADPIVNNPLDLSPLHREHVLNESTDQRNVQPSTSTFTFDEEEKEPNSFEQPSTSHERED